MESYNNSTGTLTHTETQMNNQKIKLIYIAGMWRSGGTFLGRILDCSDEIIFVGNIKDFWRKGLKRNNKCSCGEGFKTCSFWQSVTKEYMNSFPSIDIEELRKEFKQVEKWLSYFKLKEIVFNKKDNSLKPLLDKYLEHNEKLYEIVSNLSGKKIIVDSSRNTQRLLALSLLNKFQLYPIHIIRDPRGVINTLINKDIRNYNEIRHNTILNLFHWNAKNYFSMKIIDRLSTTRSVNILYKNFAAKPVTVIEGLKKMLNCKINYELDNGKFSINLGTGHIFSGNRERHKSGKITITEDTEWNEELSWLHKVLTSIISVPLFKYIVNKRKLETKSINIHSVGKHILMKS